MFELREESDGFFYSNGDSPETTSFIHLEVCKLYLIYSADELTITSLSHSPSAQCSINTSS